MRVRPRPGVYVEMAEDGRLTLFSPSSGVFKCGHIDTAIWIAIQQHDGDVDAAAQMLSDLWEIGWPQVDADVQDWILRLGAAGLLESTAD